MNITKRKGVNKRTVQSNSTYPLTKTPVPNRKIKAREAPIISQVLSGLTANRFGSGGSKLGGAVKEVEVEVEVEVDEVGVSEVALMVGIDFLGVLRLPGTEWRRGKLWMLSTPAMIFAEGFW
jgi:hypothetical protein